MALLSPLHVMYAMMCVLSVEKHRQLLAAEVVQLFCLVPAFFDLLSTDTGRVLLTLHSLNVNFDEDEDM